MLSIEEASKQISRSLQDHYIELKNELHNINELIASTTIEFRDTPSTGGVRDDFAHVEAESKLTKLNNQKQSLFECRLLCCARK